MMLGLVVICLRRDHAPWLHWAPSTLSFFHINAVVQVENSDAMSALHAVVAC